MSDIATIVLLTIGTAFAFLASVAVVRMPDLYTRMHGATKSATLGVGCTILAAAIRFADMQTTTAAILVIGFLLLTAPVAAHMIGRAAHRQQVPKWSGSVVDESPAAQAETHGPQKNTEADADKDAGAGVKSS
ncbi:MAG: monovalent cation/H(+) antiporter subunit G [Fuerstiella sp.]